MLYPEKRILQLNPKFKHTVSKTIQDYDGKEVTVLSWHQNIAKSTVKMFPDDEKVGFVEEFARDIPESELKR